MAVSPPHCYEHPHPAVTTDVVLFGLREGRLQLLLIRRAGPPFAGMWALPGGFLDIDEDIASGAARELREETGLTGIRLEQLHTFGRPGRDPRERVISIAHYALLPAHRLAEPAAASDAAEAAWFPADDLPALAFDHADIIRMARRRLAAGLDDPGIVRQCLPETFTLHELQQAHEALGGESLDAGDFRRHILARGQIEATGGMRRNGRHRPAREYRIKHPARGEYSK